MVSSLINTDHRYGFYKGLAKLGVFNKDRVQFKWRWHITKN